MTLQIESGTRLGPYEIISRIGAGGMGEVWRGRDTRLDRPVAIKVLPASLAGNEQFRARFEREAFAISQLNHPHICTLHDIGHEDGTSYLVMELLDGDSLADRLANGAMPLAEVFRYGAQIAAALDRAHRAGIVHRDLKPGNVVITRSGAKLLDFGLAKSSTSPVAVSFEGATEHKPLTKEGTILGTLQYMAPEQLAGEEADARTDIFALGALLYEMATGRRAFEGKTRTSVIAAIVSVHPPPISTIASLTPPALDHTVRRCLEKEPDDRWQSAHDVASELQWIAEAGSQAGVAAPVLSRRKKRESLAWALALAFLATTATIAFLWHRATAEPPRRIELSVLPPENGSFDFNQASMVLSPDGRKLIYVAAVEGKSQLWLRHLDKGVALPMGGTEGATHPFWSPDSRFVAFFAAGKLRKIDSNGGPPQNICEATNGRSGTWNRDGVILFAPTDRDPIHRVSASGGTAVAVTELIPDKEYSHRWPSFLPDGKHYLFLGQTYSSPQERGRIFVGTLGSKTRKELMLANSPAIYATSGHILFVRDRTLLAQAFDPKKLALIGDAFPLADQVQYFAPTGGAAFSATSNGTISYQAAGAVAMTQLTWFDRTGKPLGVIAGPPGLQSRPRLSRKGDRVAYDRLDEAAGTSDLWIHDLSRNTSTRFTFEPTEDLAAVWTPDDRRIIYTSEQVNRSGRKIVQKISSGAGQEEVLLSVDAPGVATTDVSPDGRYVAWQQVGVKMRGGKSQYLSAIAAVWE